VLKATRGHRAARSRRYRVARESLIHALAYSTAHRRLKKRTNRSLQIVRINAAARASGINYANLLPNGNLVVRGEKWLTLNQGDEYIQISGIVRPVDIRTDNTVLSTQVADARITYAGRGTLADANSMGWLARFFNSPYWPF
jgi:flagellar basal body L-ring protein FlgH